MCLKHIHEITIQKFIASAGWLNHFKNRYGLKNLNLHGVMGGVDFSVIGEELKALRQKLAEYNFNYDKTGLFVRI